MKIGRNDLCPCGSGKKYKKCCLLKEDLYILDAEAKKLFEEINSREKHLCIIPSVVHKGYRFRVIWNKIYPQPLKETFHEFILRILKSTFGQEWYNKQMTFDETDRHIMVKWVYSNYEFTKKVIQTGNKEIDEYGNAKWGGFPSGEVQALMQFAYDMYCLQVINKLPAFLIDRLKDNRKFQGARYEIAVAAMMARAGFEIEFLDGKIKADKHCEFLAKHKYSDTILGVEAKSRHRKGVLNEKGDYDLRTETRGDVWNLFTKARKQKPKGLPYLVFIDMNLKPRPDLPFDKKPWYDDIVKMVEYYGDASEANPDPYNALILTNFSYYYAGNDDTPRGEYFVVISRYPETKINNKNILDSIFESVSRYNMIPIEV